CVHKIVSVIALLQVRSRRNAAVTRRQLRALPANDRGHRIRRRLVSLSTGAGPGPSLEATGSLACTSDNMTWHCGSTPSFVDGVPAISAEHSLSIQNDMSVSRRQDRRQIDVVIIPAIGFLRARNAGARPAGSIAAEFTLAPTIM